ncbi:MAG TPA: hypothetical protein VGV67_03975 [Solirubrobacteraceae bacterium]|nr:hypothetical protein [Solirubrobacteraceae bacterium]
MHAVRGEVGSVRRARAVAHDLGQQRNTVDLLAGEVQDMGAVGAPRDLMGAGVARLPRRELHGVAQLGVVLLGLLDELVDAAHRLAAAQARADAERPGGDLVCDERGDLPRVEVAAEDDHGVVQPGLVEHAPRGARELGMVAGVDPDRAQPGAGEALGRDRLAQPVDRIVGVDEQRRPRGPRPQLVAEDVQLARTSAGHDLRVGHRPGDGDAEVARRSGGGRSGEAREVRGARGGVPRAEAVEAAHREVPHRAVTGGAHDRGGVRRDAGGVVDRRQQRRLDERRLQALCGDPQQRRAAGHDRPLARRPDRAAEAQVAQAPEHRLVERRGVLRGEPAQVGLGEAHRLEERERLLHPGDGHPRAPARGELERHDIVRRALVYVVGRHREAVEVCQKGVALVHILGG